MPYYGKWSTMEYWRECLPLTIDYVFKDVFTHEDASEPLRSLISAVLGEEVASVAIIKPDLPRFSDDERAGIIDLRAVFVDGTHAIIEIQVCHHLYIMKKAQFHLSKIYDTQLEPEEFYSKLQRAIIINFLSCSSDDFPSDSWHHVFTFQEKIKNLPMPDGMLELHIIEFPKITKKPHEEENILLAMWMMFMKTWYLSEMKIIAQYDPAILKAYEIVVELDSCETEKMLNEARTKLIYDIRTNENYVEEKGRKEGEMIGFMKGILQTSKAMISAGVDIEIVSKAASFQQADLE